MDTYVILSRLTDDGAERIKEQPERIRAVDAELEGMSVHVRAQYALLGQYDFLTIVEAPDAATVMRATTEIASRGSVRVQTFHAIPVEQFIAALAPQAMEA